MSEYKTLFERHPAHKDKVWESADGEYITVQVRRSGGLILLKAFFESIGRDFNEDDFRENHTVTNFMIRPDYMHCDEGDEMEYTKPGGVPALLWAEK